MKSPAIDEDDLLELSCDILDRVAVKPLKSELVHLGDETKRQIKLNPAMQKQIACAAVNGKKDEL